MRWHSHRWTYPLIIQQVLLEFHFTLYLNLIWLFSLASTHPCISLITILYLDVCRHRESSGKINSVIKAVIFLSWCLSISAYISHSCVFFRLAKWNSKHVRSQVFCWLVKRLSWRVAQHDPDAMRMEKLWHLIWTIFCYDFTFSLLYRGLREGLSLSSKVTNQNLRFIL